MKKLCLLSATLFLILCSACSKDSEPKSDEGGNNPSNMILGNWRISYYEQWYEKKGDSNKYERIKIQPDPERDYPNSRYLFNDKGSGVYTKYNNDGSVRGIEPITYNYSNNKISITYNPDSDPEVEYYDIAELSQYLMILEEKSLASNNYDYICFRSIFAHIN